MQQTWRLAGMLASAMLVLTVAAPLSGFAQELAATFGERYPRETPATEAPAAPPPQQPAPQAAPANGPLQTAQVRKRARTASAKRVRTRVVVEPRSFLDAGTEVLPGERKFTDYAFPPTHTPMDVVQNTGGRVGWHRSPLPGPFSPWFD